MLPASGPLTTFHLNPAPFRHLGPGPVPETELAQPCSDVMNIVLSGCNTGNLSAYHPPDAEIKWVIKFIAMNSLSDFVLLSFFKYTFLSPLEKSIDTRLSGVKFEYYEL